MSWGGPTKAALVVEPAHVDLHRSGAPALNRQSDISGIAVALGITSQVALMVVLLLGPWCEAAPALAGGVGVVVLKKS